MNPADRRALVPILAALFVAVVTVASGCAAKPASSAGDTPLQKFVAFGTAAKGGVYHPVGEGFCRLINAQRESKGIRCLAYVTGGSVFNVQAIGSRQLDLAITRADLAFQGYTGTGPFSAYGAMRDLRVIARLYEMPLTVLVRAEGPVRTWEGLRGHSINIGNLGSGKRTLAKALFAAAEWSDADFSTVHEHDSDAASQAFCDGRVDALIENMGLPAAYYDRLTHDCGARFLSIPDGVRTKLLHTYGYMEPTTIAGGTYPHNPQPVETIGVATVLLTSARIPAPTIAAITAAIYADMGRMRAVHSALAAAEAPHAGEISSVPVHEGVAQYPGTRPQVH